MELGHQDFRGARNVECLLGEASGTERSFPMKEAISVTAGSVFGAELSKPSRTRKGLLDRELQNLMFSWLGSAPALIHPSLVVSFLRFEMEMFILSHFILEICNCFHDFTGTAVKRSPWASVETFEWPWVVKTVGTFGPSALCIQRWTSASILKSIGFYLKCLTSKLRQSFEESLEVGGW